MEPCPYRQGEVLANRNRVSATTQVAAMEPCPYRQGESPTGWSLSMAAQSRNGALPLSAGRVFDPDATYEITYEVPQWSPALIGRESGWEPADRGWYPPRRNGALPLSAGRANVQPGVVGRYSPPQWSPALIGRERTAVPETPRASRPPQWSPALIGRERGVHAWHL